MNRKTYIKNIIQAVHWIKQKTCKRMCEVPGVAITPSQWGLLHILHKRKQMSVKEVAETMSITGSAVTQMSVELEKKGYVQRAVDQNDRRTTLLTMTDESNIMMNKLDDILSTQLEELFGVLSDKELATFSKLHQKVADSQK